MRAWTAHSTVTTPSTLAIPPIVPTASAVPDSHVGHSSSGKPTTKLPKLLTKYSRQSTGTSVKLIAATPLSEYHKSLTMCAELLAKIEDDDDDEPEDCLELWHNKRKELPNLFKLAMKVHSVPATSATLERVFSQGGIILRPQRACMGDKTLANIIFLKCNKMGE